MEVASFSGTLQCVYQIMWLYMPEKNTTYPC